ncbi:MAG: UbiA family prenyltransferase [Candidatus Aminicenantes bacterium]|nr:UbiA family prenyltransferase [Candidatus Aminicenantes bacterium]
MDPEKSLLTRIEDLGVPFWGLLAWFLAVISVREGLEQVFFEKPFGLYLYYHHAFFFLVALAAGILALSLWTRTDIVRTARVVACGYVLVILPPLLDRLAFHRPGRYEYSMPGHFLKKALTFFRNEPGAGKGIFIEIVVLLILVVVYTVLKARSGWRAAGAGLTLYGIFAVAGTPRLFLPIPRMSVPGVFESRHILYAGVYLVLLLAIVAAGFGLYRLKLLKAVFRDLLSFRSAHFALMAAAGVYFNSGIRRRPFPGLLYGLIAVLLALLVWVVTVLWNNAHDLEIDRITGRSRPLVLGWVTPGEYIRLGRAVALFSLFTSGLLGAKAFLIVGLALFSAQAYSAPPLRLRLRLASNLFIGWGSFLMFCLGYFAWTTIKEWPLERVPVSVSLIILGALSLGTLTKDAKDYEGDLKVGARTVFTVLGPEKGGRFAAAGLLLSLLTPLILFHGLVDILAYPLIAVAAAIAFERNRRLIVPFAAYAAAFAYAVARTVGLIGGRM